jgi:site-specific recombinase XerD
MKNQEETMVARASRMVPGFERVYKQLQTQIAIRGQSTSSLHNYARCLARLCLHFGRLPEEVCEDEINEYLASLAQSTISPSKSYFKHTVYGLRYYYRLVGLNPKALALPSIKHDNKLPVVLNRGELRALFKAPQLLKHRTLLALIYSAGLRVQEACNLKLADIDFERMSIHVRQSKYKKDRIVPLGKVMAFGLRRYIAAEHPHVYLFNGKELDGPMSTKAMQWAMQEAVKKAGIQKDVSLHSLRHSYATHLLEDGVNIVTLKELLGHSEITTTMIYLHVAQCAVMQAGSPIDSLYAEQCARL